MIKLSKNLLYAGIAILVIGYLISGLGSSYIFNSLPASYPLAIFNIFIQTIRFFTAIILTNEILKQIKNNHSFSLLYVLLSIGFVISKVMILGMRLGATMMDFRSSYYWLPDIIIGLINLIICIKFFMLRGVLSSIFKVYAFFLLATFLESYLQSVITRHVSVSEFRDLNYNLISLIFNGIRAVLVSYLFYQSSKHLDGIQKTTQYSDIIDDL